jgi:uncharacterized protein
MRRREREIVNIEEIESIISCADVCRIAFADGNDPYIVTMNFGYSGGNEKKIYFHCAVEGKKLEMIRKNNYVCFEMDTDHNLHTGKNACNCGMSYRSVVGWGRISVLTDNEEKKTGLDSIMSHYSPEKSFSYDQSTLDRTLLLRLDIQKVTGKKSM